MEHNANYPPVLDVCCGPKGFWFNKSDPRAMFVDKRREILTMVYPSGTYREEINPTIVADFTKLPFDDNTFALVVFDPPHIQRSGADGRMTKRYGFLEGDWKEMIRKGFEESFRVLRSEGVLIFKWCSIQFPLSDILSLTSHLPLFGHKTKSKTHWVCFIKERPSK